MKLKQLTKLSSVSLALLGLSMGFAQANVVWDGDATGVWEDPNNWLSNDPVPVNRLPVNGEWIRPTAVSSITYSAASGTTDFPGSILWQDTGASHATHIQTGGDLTLSSLFLTQLKTNTLAPAYTMSGGSLTAGTMNITWNNSSSVGSKFLQTGGDVTIGGNISMAGKSSTQGAVYELQDGNFTAGTVLMGNGSANSVTEFTQSGGTATVNSYVRMGYNCPAGSSIYNLDGGTLTIKNDADPLRFETPTGPWIQTSSPSYVKVGDGWEGAYWAVVDSDPGAAEEWVAEQQFNKHLTQVWNNTVTETGDATLGFDLDLRGDSSLSVMVVGWRQNALGVGDDPNGNALRYGGWEIACESGYVADVLLGSAGAFVTNAVVDGNEKVFSFYDQNTDGDGITIPLDAAVDLSQYDYIGVKFFNAGYGVQLDNISLTTADGGEAVIDVPDFEKADLEPLVAGGAPVVYFDFDGGTLNLKGTWDFASLTAILSSDFRVAGVPAGDGDLVFTPITIDLDDYTQITVNTTTPNPDLVITSTSKVGNTVTVNFEGIDGQTYDLNKAAGLDGTFPGNPDSTPDAITLSGTTSGSLEDTGATEDAAFSQVKQQ